MCENMKNYDANSLHAKFGHFKLYNSSEANTWDYRSKGWSTEYHIYYIQDKKRNAYSTICKTMTN